MRPAQPLPKLLAAPHARRVPRNVALEVVGAHPARVQPREELHEAHQVRLLRPRGRLGERRRDAVQERPGAAAQGLDVRRALGLLLHGGGGGFWLLLGRLGGEGGECGLGGAAAAASGEVFTLVVSVFLNRGYFKNEEDSNIRLSFLVKNDTIGESCVAISQFNALLKLIGRHALVLGFRSHLVRNSITPRDRDN